VAGPGPGPGGKIPSVICPCLTYLGMRQQRGCGTEDRERNIWTFTIQELGR